MDDRGVTPAWGWRDSLAAVLTFAALLGGLLSVGLLVYGVVLVVQASAPCPPDERCEGWGAFFGGLSAVVGVMGGLTSLGLQAGARALRNPGGPPVGGGAGSRPTERHR